MFHFQGIDYMPFGPFFLHLPITLSFHILEIDYNTSQQMKALKIYIHRNAVLPDHIFDILNDFAKLYLAVVKCGEIPATKANCSTAKV